MHTDHPFPWHRIAQTLETTPILVKHLVQEISDVEADYRPDPERLTIREIVDHLAEWEPILFGTLQRICAEDVPVLEEGDPVGKPKAESANSPGVPTQWELFAKNRAATVAFLRDRTTADWGRQAIRSIYGPTTLDAQAVMLVMHDTYHIRQIVEWRERYAEITRTSENG